MIETTPAINLSHARTEEQRLLMKRIEKDGVCPFCPENIEHYHAHPVTLRYSCMVTRNMAPYSGAKEHWLIIPKRHIQKFSDLSAYEQQEIFLVMKELEEKRKFPGCSIIMRSGTTNYTGASVAHFHAHVIAGGACREQGEALRVKIGYVPRLPT